MSTFFLFESLFPILFTLVFCFVIGMFIVTGVRALQQKRKNDASPRLEVRATVRSRRTQVGSAHHHDADGFDRTSYHTRYFVTFEFPSGDRQEFSVSGQEYGILAEGDCGMLRFQGTRYLGFTRT